MYSLEQTTLKRGIIPYDTTLLSTIAKRTTSNDLDIDLDYINNSII